jgi:hypothetical protein
MKTSEAVIASTSIDRQGEQLTREALEHLAEWIGTHFVPIGVEHDPRRAPIGRIASAFVRDRSDGESEVVATLEVFEKSDAVDNDQRELILRDRGEGLSITYDWTHRHAADQEDIEAIANALGTEAIYEGKKAAEPISVITLAAGFILSSIAAGFFGELGSAAYIRLKERLVRIFRRKNIRQGEQLLKLSFFRECDGKPVEVVLLVTNPSEEDIDGVFSEGFAALDRILPMCIDKVPNVRRLTFEYKVGAVQMLFGVSKDCRPWRPISKEEAETSTNLIRETSSMATRKIGRDAGTGHFKPVKDAKKDKQGSVVETIKVPAPRKPSKKK